MTGRQKTFIFEIVVAVSASLAFLGVALWTGNMQTASAAFALLALLALSKRVQGDGPVDERDRAIWKRASQVGHTVFWVVFVLGCVGLYELMPPPACIPVETVVIIPFFAAVLLVRVRGVAGLVLYARGV